MVAFLIPLAAAAIGAGASAIAGASGVGKNSFRATNFGKTSEYDANRFRYGALAGGSEAVASRYGAEALNAQDRYAPQANYAEANSALYQGQRDRFQGERARYDQERMAYTMQQRAMGLTPSIAQAQSSHDIGLLGRNSQRDIGMLGQNSANDIGMLQRGGQQQMQQALAAQSSLAASARGAAGMALAQQNAANNTANAHGQIGTNVAMATRDIGRQSAMAAQNIGMQSQMTGENVANQAQVNAMQERMQAEQAAFGAYAGLRGGDMASQMNHAQIAQQQMQGAQFNTSVDMQQRALNDQQTMGLYGLQNSVRSQQLQADMTQQGLMAASHSTSQGQNMGANQANANREMDTLKMGVGAVQGAASMGMPAGGGAAPKAEGGPVVAGKPYLVGERGPELIVPQKHGLVVPNDQLSYRDVRDLGDVDTNAEALDRVQRIGRREPTSFHRDDAQDQAAVKRAFLAKAAREADEYIDAMRADLRRGASVSRYEGELDEPSQAPAQWLAQYMGEQPSAAPLSDDHAKLQAAWDAGSRATHRMYEQARSGGPSDERGAREPAGGVRLDAAQQRLLDEAARNKAAGRVSSGDGQYEPRPREMKSFQRGEPEHVEHPDVREGRERAGLVHYEREIAPKLPGHVRSSSDATNQLATGLAPINFQYKPGLGPPGMRPGVRAQGMESQPMTAPAVRVRPDGLREIDPAQGLSTALAGVGHLAQKQTEQEALIASLLRRSGR
jgi:hypothetical protein